VFVVAAAIFGLCVSLSLSLYVYVYVCLSTGYELLKASGLFYGFALPSDLSLNFNKPHPPGYARVPK